MISSSVPAFTIVVGPSLLSVYIPLPTNVRWQVCITHRIQSPFLRWHRHFQKHCWRNFPSQWPLFFDNADSRRTFMTMAMFTHEKLFPLPLLKPCNISLYGERHTASHGHRLHYFKGCVSNPCCQVLVTCPCCSEMSFWELLKSLHRQEWHDSDFAATVKKPAMTL